MVPMLHRTPSSSCPCQSRDPCTREPGRGRTEPILPEEKLGSETGLKGSKVPCSPSCSTGLPCPCPLLRGSGMDAPVSSSALLLVILRASRRQAPQTTAGLGEPRTHPEQTFLEGTSLCLPKAEEGIEMGTFLEQALHHPSSAMKRSDLSAQLTFWGGLQSPQPPAKSQNAVWRYLSLPTLEGPDMDLT